MLGSIHYLGNTTRQRWGIHLVMDTILLFARNLILSRNPILSRETDIVSRKRYDLRNPILYTKPDIIYQIRYQLRNPILCQNFDIISHDIRDNITDYISQVFLRLSPILYIETHLSRLYSTCPFISPFIELTDVADIFEKRSGDDFPPHGNHPPKKFEPIVHHISLVFFKRPLCFHSDKEDSSTKTYEVIVCIEPRRLHARHARLPCWQAELSCHAWREEERSKF